MNNVNPSILNIAGRSSNELYTVNVPSNLLNFCNYDFTYFMEESSRLCRESMKTGEYPSDEVNAVKNAITNCHKYFENNMRGIFDKIVVDSWIEYICRQGEMGTTTLWNTFAGCKTNFQRTVFQRLSEYRSHRAINQWVNLLKMQEYAQKKLDFIFGCKLNNVGEAVGRLNLFDLMFSVAANEQGYSLDAIGSVKVFKGGRLPNAPFVFGGAAKEVIRSLFNDVHFADKLPYVSRYEGAMSDWEAMDSFAVIKSHLPDYTDNVANTIMKSMVKLPETVYLPSGFKAMIDLEIDTLVNSGAFLQRCKRCKEFYIRDDYYTSEYCDTVHRDGTTCREVMESPPIKVEPLTTEQIAFIKESSEAIYREMSARLGTGLSQRDFSEWLSNFNVIRNKVLGSEADISVFEEFVRYTREYALPQPEPEPEPEPQELTEDNRVVKPYQFTHMSRSELVQQGLLKKEREYENESPVAVAAAAASAAPPPPPVAKIIRGAHPTSYHEIPVGELKPDTVKEEAFAAAATAGEAARAAIQSLGAEEAAQKQKAQELQQLRQAQQAQQAQQVQQAQQAQQVQRVQKAAESGRVHLPELEDFGAAEPSRVQRERRAPQVKLPDFGLQEEVRQPDFGRQEEIKLPDFGRQEEIRQPDFGRQEEVFTAATEPQEDDGQEELKLPDFLRQEDEILSSGRQSVAQQPDFIVEDEDEEFVNLEERLDKAAAKKSGEMNRAARVVNAYKSVNDMPKLNEQSTANEDGAADRVKDDFAKILDNIERNDGFDEEDLPLDPDGIPLSHKTKHVMDAIMKNTRVSPSLIYGRRQAAEQNVLIDEDSRDSKQ